MQLLDTSCQDTACFFINLYSHTVIFDIGVVARGCSGCTCTPRAVKFFRRNLQGICAGAPPGHEVHSQVEQESIFRTFFCSAG